MEEDEGDSDFIRSLPRVGWKFLWNRGYRGALDRQSRIGSCQTAADSCNRKVVVHMLFIRVLENTRGSCYGTGSERKKHSPQKHQSRDARSLPRSVLRDTWTNLASFTAHPMLSSY